MCNGFGSCIFKDMYFKYLFITIFFSQARYIEGGNETAVKIVKIDAADDWAAIQQEVDCIKSYI